jgi:hypothetical protein
MKKFFTTMFLLTALTLTAQIKTLLPPNGNNTPNFNSNNAWSPNGAPACGDTLIIPAGLSFTVPNNIVNPGLWGLDFGTYQGPLVITCISALPIVLLDFSIEYIDDQVQLNWTTGSEKDNDYFLLESSKEGYYWNEVARVKSVGTSSSEEIYKYVDKNPYIGKSYYRLTQFDVNGKGNDLGIVVSEYETNKYLIYPVPVNKLMFLEGMDLDKVEITIFSNMGEIINVENKLFSDKMSFNFEQVKSGVYFIQIDSEKNRKLERIVVVHK